MFTLPENRPNARYARLASMCRERSMQAQSETVSLAMGQIAEAYERRSKRDI
jgi:hypothetical protein